MATEAQLEADCYTLFSKTAWINVPRNFGQGGPAALARARRLEARARAALRGRPAKFRQNVARFWLYRLRFLQENMRFAAFFKIYNIIKLKFLKFGKFYKFCDICNFLAEISRKLLFFQTDFLRIF